MSTPTTTAADTTAAGEFKRRDSALRSWIQDEPDAAFPAESGRYHLYVTHGCPWANRTSIVRNLKGLQQVVSLSFLVGGSHKPGIGWHFTEDYPDPNNPGFQLLKEIYLQHDPQYEHNISVPVLYDKKTKKIVNNESSEIIRMLNSAFNRIATNPTLDLYPSHLQSSIDEINSWVYPQLNNGVYRAGFSKTQEAYEPAFNDVFTALDRLEEILSKRRYLTGDTLTEADVRAFTTLVRFDSVYHYLFKCNRNHLYEMPNLWNYTRELYQRQEFGSTIHFDVIKKGYFSMINVNPFRVTPLGPRLDWAAPHHRQQKFS